MENMGNGNGPDAQSVARGSKDQGASEGWEEALVQTVSSLDRGELTKYCT